jgi:CBS domain-containing protein
MKVKALLANKPTGVVTIAPDQSLQDAAQLLAQHNIGALVAVNPAGKPVGILSERDIVRHIARQGTGALALTVNDAMTKDIIIALPSDDLGYLSSTMTEKRIRHLPVMQDAQLIGMVSIGDVVKAQLDHVEGEARALERYITGGHA